jgi:DNA gyrase subunit A
MQIETPSSLLRRALGDDGYAAFVEERGEAESYTLTPVQADAILHMTLGQLVNLEQEKLAGEHHKLLEEIAEYKRILSDRQNILEMIREDCREMKRRFGDARRTEISGEEVGEIDMEDLITEETMVVSITSNGYIKRTPASVYRAQRRGGKGLTGAKTEDEDPVQHLFVASTHAYLLFFTNKGKVYWRKVYDLPQLARDSRGRAVVNLLNLTEGEQITDCRAVRDFDKPDHFLVMATARGLVKKTPLEAYSRPLKSGIIAIKLREGDALVDVVVAKAGDELVLATARGMAIRFKQSDARPMGRNSSGVKGIKLVGDDSVVGMVVADPDATLLTVCVHGYGKRTPFGPNMEGGPEDELPEGPEGEEAEEDVVDTTSEPESEEEGDEHEESSQRSYRTQRRGGKGIRDIKTTDRNGPVIGISHISDEDELLMMTAHGKLQRIAASDINIIGRNTQGVRIMSLDDDDTLIAVKRVPKEEENDKPEEGEKKPE